MIKKFIILANFILLNLFSNNSEKKLIICGIAKDIGNGSYVTIDSCEKLFTYLHDYRVIIYENNSSDDTKKILGTWAQNNSKIKFISEDLNDEFKKAHGLCTVPYSTVDRINLISRARNIVLDETLKKEYEEFPYLMMVDLDTAPWDIKGIIETLDNKDYSWDAVVSNGLYDSFAYRDEDCPIGWEIIGSCFWEGLSKGEYNSRKDYLTKTKHWKRVISGFGGLAIYKRNSIKNARYSAYITKNLEKILTKAIYKKINAPPKEKRENLKHTPFLAEYLKKTRRMPCYRINDKYIHADSSKGVIIDSLCKAGEICWFGIDLGNPRPWTCEHINFHADMIADGFDRIYFNPLLISNQLPN